MLCCSGGGGGYNCGGCKLVTVGVVNVLLNIVMSL